jgi:hypothetical protein
LSGCNSLAGDSLGSGSNGPDKAQQLSGYCCNDLPLVLAGCAQFHIALVQPMLRLPCNLLGLFRDALLSSAQSIPDTWWTTITKYENQEFTTKYKKNIGELFLLAGTQIFPRGSHSGFSAINSSAVRREMVFYDI